MAQQGMAITRPASGLSRIRRVHGNTTVLGKLLDQAVAQPDVESAMVNWAGSSQTDARRGHWPSAVANQQGQPMAGRIASLVCPSRSTDIRSTRMTPTLRTGNRQCAAGVVAVGIDLHRKQVLVQRLLGHEPDHHLPRTCVCDSADLSAGPQRPATVAGHRCHGQAHQFGELRDPHGRHRPCAGIASIAGHGQPDE